MLRLDKICFGWRLGQIYSLRLRSPEATNNREIMK